jgi:hypothetical protein
MKARRRMVDAAPLAGNSAAKGRGLRHAMSAAVALLICSGCSDAPDSLPYAIRQVWASNPGSKIDITPTVTRFIPIGSSTDDGLALLRRHGFRVYDNPDRRAWVYKGAADHSYLTSRDDRWGFLRLFFPLWLFSRIEWRIILSSNNGKVVAVHGYIFHHSL